MQGVTQRDWEEQACAVLRISQGLEEKERRYLSKWYAQGVDIDNVRRAGDRCRVSQGKVSFPYVDAILQHWNDRADRPQVKVTVEDIANLISPHTIVLLEDRKSEDGTVYEGPLINMRTFWNHREVVWMRPCQGGFILEIE